jgi:high-affinity nickel-transport protein
VLAAAVTQATGLALIFVMFAFGFRHGIDWDHIAAITDITSSQENKRDSIIFGELYALGHGVVVLAIGAVAIFIGWKLPRGVDDWAARVVGVTLLILGVYVLVSLIRHGRDFRMRSRWMLIFSGVRKGSRWVRTKVGTGAGASGDVVDLTEMELEEGQDPTDPSLWHHGHHGRPGHHHHKMPEKDDEFMNYGKKTAFTVGMLHGIGGETPTQAVLFAGLAVGGASSATRFEGVAVLFVFLVGLFVSNTLLVLGSTYGYLSATRNFAVYVAVALLTAFFSLVIGFIFVTGGSSGLPAIFGG